MKNFRNIVTVFVIVVSFGLLLVSCKPTKNDDPQPQQITRGKAADWLTPPSSNTLDTATIRDGYLYLSTTNNGNGANVASYNSLEGDFSMKINISAMHLDCPVDLSEFLNISLDAPSYNGTTHLSIDATVSEQSIEIKDASAITSSMKSISAPDQGEFFAERIGSTINAWIRVGEDTVKIHKANYTSDPLHINIGLYSTDPSVERASVHIDDVTISGGGHKVVSDTFDKNTLGF